MEQNRKFRNKSMIIKAPKIYYEKRTVPLINGIGKAEKVKPDLYIIHKIGLKWSKHMKDMKL
jgi:hypothetical protein